MKKTFISNKEKWFSTDMTEVLQAVKDCYIEQVRYNSHVKQLEESSESYEIYEEVEHGRLLGGINQCKRCVEVY